MASQIFRPWKDIVFYYRVQLWKIYEDILKNVEVIVSNAKISYFTYTISLDSVQNSSTALKQIWILERISD